MAQHGHVSSFGNRGGEEGVPCAEVFPEMLKGREGEEHEVRAMTQEQRTSEDDNSEFKRNLGSPAGDDTRNRPTKPSAGSGYSIEKSPMHKHARTSGIGSSSPMLEGRATRDEMIHGNPGRARLASSSRGDEHDKGVTVPKFGEWDENNPSGEGYTQVFKAVREEREGIVRSGNDAPPDSSHSSAARRANDSGSKGCCSCCPWLTR